MMRPLFIPGISLSAYHVEMIQDDKKRWALYIKPENKSGYSIYPDKEDINRFFSTLKQAMDNIGKVRLR